MTVGGDTGAGSTVPSDHELAEHDHQRPARRLPPVPIPQGMRFALVIFLAAIAPITLLISRLEGTSALRLPINGLLPKMQKKYGASARRRRSPA